MASIAQLKNGLKRIDFYDGAGERKSIRIGKMSMRDAEKIQTKIEELNAAKINGNSLPTDVAVWLADRPTKFYEKLVRVDLAEPRADVVNLEPFIDEYVSKQTFAQPSSKDTWRQGKLALIEFFGPDKPLAEITPGLADDFKANLQNSTIRRGKNKGKKIASMTARNRMDFAKKIFRAAFRHKLIASNPFDEMTIETTMPDMARFVTTEETEKLLDACPNQDWRTIVALARWGGLRCPSEVLSLKLSDIDWERNRILVTSPKTAHHPGKDTRTIPLFAELREPLLAASEAAPEGAIYVVDEKYRRQAWGPRGWRSTKLRTTFEKIVARAGLVQWSRLFHNLRASRQTELQEIYPSHVVCAWLGNSEKIARKHYLKVTDGHFAKATGDQVEPQEKAQRKAQRYSALPRGTAYLGATQKRENPERNENQLDRCAVVSKCDTSVPTRRWRAGPNQQR